MSKEEFLKIQTCVLKVNIHCDGCKQKVKKILQKIDGVFTIKIDAEAGKVTVSGNVEPAVLIRKLAKSGKHAELWGAPKPNNNNNLPTQFKNMQIDNGKGGNNNKNHKGNNHHPPQNNQPKHPGGPPNQQFQQQLQQLQQLQQMKGLQDLNLPQFKGMKLPNYPQNNNQQKTVKFAGLPDDDELSDEFDDEFDDEDDDDDDDMYDDEFDDGIDDHPLNHKMKPNMGGANGLPPAIQNMINAQKGVQSNGAANAKKGGPGNGAIPVQINMGNGAAKNGGKNGGNNNSNHHHPQGGNQNNGGKNGGGKPQEAKNGNNGGGGGKNGNGGGGGGHGNNMQGHGGKKGNNGGQGGGGSMNDGFQRMGGPQGQMGNMNIPMGNMPMGQLGNMAAVQGLPAAAASMNGGGGGGAPNGYFQGAGPEPMPGNPYHQQQYLAAMMNQQRAMGNERFQPMMYARPPPAVNYMPQYPYPYPPQPQPQPHPYTSDPYTNIFSDENTSSCSVM